MQQFLQVRSGVGRVIGLCRQVGVAAATHVLAGSRCAPAQDRGHGFADQVVQAGAERDDPDETQPHSPAKPPGMSRPVIAVSSSSLNVRTSDAASSKVR